jgi:YggT family protein
LNRH